MGEMNPLSIMARAEKLGVPDLQRSIQNGTIPAYIGIPMLQEKVKQAKQMQMSMAAQQPKRPSVAEQVLSESAQQPAVGMGIPALPSNLPEEGYADGGIVAFAGGGNTRHFYEGGFVPNSLKERLKYIKEHGLIGTPIEAAKQAYGWSSDLAKATADPQTYADLYSNVKSGYGDLDALTKNILWGSPEQAVAASSQNQSNIPPTPSSQMNARDLQNTVRSAMASNNPNANSFKSNQLQIPAQTATGWDLKTAQPEAQFTNAQDLQTEINLLRRQGNNADADILQSELDKQIKSGEIKGYPAGSKNNYGYTGTTFEPSSDVGVKSLPIGKLTAPTIPFDETSYDASLHNADETDARKQMEGIKGLLPENTGAADLRKKISEMEASSKSAEDKAPWMALMKAGLATMAGTSPFALTNIGAGGQAGLEDYIKSKNELEKSAEKRYDMQSRLEAAQRSEDVAVATKGYDSAAANRAADVVAKREKARDKAANAHYNAQLQLEADKANLNADIEGRRISSSEKVNEANIKHLSKPDLYTYINQIQNLRAEGKTKEADDLQELVSSMVHPFHADEKTGLSVDKAFQLYLQDKMPEVPTGLSKEEFIKYYTEGQSAPKGGIQTVNGRKTYVGATQ